MRLLLSVLMLAALCLTASAAGNPEIEAIHQEIKTLKAEEKVRVQRVNEWYERIVKRDKWTEKMLIEERKTLKKQEDNLLAQAQTNQARKEIHEHFDGIRALLRKDSQSDAEMIRKLRYYEKEQEKHVAEPYRMRIEKLEALLKTIPTRAGSRDNRTQAPCLTPENQRLHGVGGPGNSVNHPKEKEKREKRKQRKK